ncbi:MAG: hypothetical protein JOY96_00505 [Verrucomicrobia bacterium]|nr:hypothetical protein [Verrucomicrobiota bacterium]MBV9674125.1 hypothetical protein [Verrucomicrobiota bacterium]
MHRLLIGVLAFFLPAIAQAQDSAYKALRSVGKLRTEKALNEVVLISGRSGRPQPPEWEVSLDDPTARNGIRELDVVAGQITAERTPLRGPETAPVDLKRLNLDSDNAFRIAEEAAARNHVSFDSVNYQLASEGPSSAPVWTLQLFDYEQRPVGVVRIAADTGTLISGTNWVPEAVGRNVANAPAYGPQPVPPPDADRRPPNRVYDASRDGVSNGSDARTSGTLGEKANRFGASVVRFGETVAHRTERIARKVGGWFQEKFTGQNTLDPYRRDTDPRYASPDDDDGNDNYPGPSRDLRSVPPPRDPYSQPVAPSSPGGQ